jgi:predicted transcriptional regulator
MVSALRRSASRIGELVLNNDKFSYKSWNSAQLVGKVRVVQHIAGRSSAKEKTRP